MTGPICNSPIKGSMLRILLHQTNNYFMGRGQCYLAQLYCCLFSTAYFELFRVGELTTGTHPVLVTNVHIARNKRKILFVLRTSKTHSKYSQPQSIKITSTNKCKESDYKSANNQDYCPYQILRDYITMRPKYLLKQESFFIFADRTPIKPICCIIGRNGHTLQNRIPASFCLVIKSY